VHKRVAQATTRR